MDSKPRKLKAFQEGNKEMRKVKTCVSDWRAGDGNGNVRETELLKANVQRKQHISEQAVFLHYEQAKV